MAIVNGVLADFGRGALANSSYDLHPQISFIPSGVGTKLPASLIVTRPIVVVPTVSTGAFTADLEPNEGLQPDTWFTIVVSWLDAAGNYVAKDFVPWELRVPNAGGAIADLISVPSNPAHVYVSLTPPVNATPGTWWLKTNPDDITDPANTGLLYEMGA